MRKYATFASLLVLIFAAFTLAAYSEAGSRRAPLLLFRAYHEGGDFYGGDLYLYDVQHQFTIRLTTPNGASEFGAVMSPDWRHIALTEASGTFSALEIMQLDTTWRLTPDPVPLLRHNQIDMWGSQAWSPHLDGNVLQLAFTTNADPELDFSEWRDFDIWVVEVPMRTWQPEDVTPTTSGSIFPPLSGEINRTRRRLTRDDSNESDLAWSPDGTQMAFVSDRDGNHEIYVLDTDGINKNIRRITHDPANDTHPTWSPDGQWLAFASDRDSNSEIYVVRVNGNESRRLTYDPANDLEPAWSPDGKFISYRSDGIITIMRPDGSRIEPLFPGTFPSWVP